MPLTIAYLSQGKVRLKVGDDSPRTVESPYINTIQEREVRAQQRNAWKGKGDGFLSGQVLWGSAASQRTTPVFVTSISNGTASGSLLYSIESGSLCAMLAADNLGAEERRLWNNNNIKLQHVRACSTTGHVAFSVIHQNGTASLGVMLKDETGVKELTEGDSVDTAPQWVPGEGRRIVFQSAGVGRDRNGHFAALGPFAIQHLDLDTTEMTTLVEDPSTDFISPRATPDGSLYYIRRPYAQAAPMSLWKFLKDVVLFPFRLGRAIFHFLNFFSMAFSGKKLSSAGNARAKEMDLRQMMIYGNVVHAQREAEADEAADLVPSTWQLARRRDNKEEIIARGVLAYDVANDGTIAYSNGNAIFVISPDGRKDKVLSERMIEQVVLLQN